MSGSNDHIDGTQESSGDRDLTSAIAHLKDGGVVAVPTETVYGLAADATNAGAVAEIYRTKGRPSFNPLIVHVPDLDAAQSIGEFNVLAIQMAQKFWPGPLTLVVPHLDHSPIASAVTAVLPSIALRCPAHPTMRALLKQSELFLAAPSANKSGKISPTTADHVHRSLGDDAPLIIDGGACEAGLESTIVAIREEGYQILRPGPITAEQLTDCSGSAPIVVESGAIESPGQLASHYAPSKSVRLNVKIADKDEYHIGFGAIEGDRNLSPHSDLAMASANLFAFLHLADDSDRPKIAVAPIDDEGMGQAINDRLRRAAK